MKDAMEMKKSDKRVLIGKLRLNKETIRQLKDADLKIVAGGAKGTISAADCSNEVRCVEGTYYRCP